MREPRPGVSLTRTAEEPLAAAPCPTGCSNRSPVLMSTTVIEAAARPGRTIVTLPGENPDHTAPLACAPASESGPGAVRGLPQLHFTLGTPVRSTSTAVPAWSTDCNGVATPS